MRLNFVGIGPQRAGTTWLHANLAQHRDVCLPKPPIKETFFFDQRFDKGWRYYEAFFSSEDRDRAAVVGEFGPSYFDVAEAPARIRSINPDCKIIISVRNPVERAYSLFVHMASYGAVPGDFDEAVRQAPQIVDSGRYRMHVERWMTAFSRSQIHFVVLDDVKREPQLVLDDVCNFLEIDRHGVFENAGLRVNVARQPGSLPLRQLKRFVWRTLSTRHQHGLLQVAKTVWRMGPSRLEDRSRSQSWLPLTFVQRQTLSAVYEDDIRFIEGALHRSFPEWRSTADDGSRGPT